MEAPLAHLFHPVQPAINLPVETRNTISLCAGPTKNQCELSRSPAPIRVSLRSSGRIECKYLESSAQDSASRHYKQERGASCCPLNSSVYHKPRRKAHVEIWQQIRSMHRSSLIMPPLPPIMPTREELLYFVDTYREFSSTKSTWSSPGLSAPAMISSPEPISVTHNQDFRSPQATPDSAAASSNDASNVSIPTAPPGASHLTMPKRQAYNRLETKNLESLLKILKAKGTHHETFEAYSKLPSPGVALLHESQIRTLFNQLSLVEKKDKTTALRFLSVIDDMKALNLPIKDAEWNSAISFCGQALTYVRDENLEQALKSWKAMEEESSVKAGIVTFNILFDIAAKSGKFVLADMILKEMEIRDLGFNRFSRVSKIYFYGLKGDGDGVRRAYRELVEAKEIVDTVVLNCVIAAFINAGEAAAAEHVYGRMLQVLWKHNFDKDPSRTWQHNRALGRLYDHLARERRGHNRSPLINLLRGRMVTAPNLHTYAILIDHHANVTGDLGRIAGLLGEMKAFGISLHGRIFRRIFKGFTAHGGQVYTEWTFWRLKRVYQALLEVYDGGTDGIIIQKWLVVWVVRAFGKLGGTDWATHVWEELGTRWSPNDEELEQTYQRVKGLLKPAGVDGQSQDGGDAQPQQEPQREETNEEVKRRTVDMVQN